jgi:hypothetical protein
MINDIDERCDLIREKILYKRCEYMLFLFDEIVDGFKTAEKYLYFRPRPYDVLSSDESDDESDNESSNNESSSDKVFVEIEYEDVCYLEVEGEGDIYSLNHSFVGRWDENTADIIWANDKARLDHESVGLDNESDTAKLDKLD